MPVSLSRIPDYRRCIIVEVAAKPKRRPRPAGLPDSMKARPSKHKPGSIAELTDEFNQLVPKVEALGIKRFKHHSSVFGSREAALKQIAIIKEFIADASVRR